MNGENILGMRVESKSLAGLGNGRQGDFRRKESKILSLEM